VTEPASSDHAHEALRWELLRLEQRVDLSAQVQFTRSAYWNALNVSLNLLTALLAGLAGVSSLAEVAGQVWAGLLALGAAALAAVNTAVTADRRSSAASTAANEYIEIRDALRHLRRLDLPDAPVERARTELRELTNRLHAVNKSDDEESETRQHLFSGHLERAVDHMIQVDSTGQPVCIRYADFSRDFLTEEQWPAFRHIARVLTDFHPARKPVFWRILLTQAHLHAAFIKTFESSAGASPSPVGPLDALPETKWDDYDWRASDEASWDSAVVEPMVAARRYLQSRLMDDRD
jgi:hypothetical protein